jgi:hypothetical protein
LKKVAEWDKESVVIIQPTLRSPDEEVLKEVIENQEGIFMVEVTVCHRDATIARWGGTTR